MITVVRHTFATRLTAAGVPEFTIAHKLGHSTTQIVPRYAQVLDEDRLDAVRKLEALRRSAVRPPQENIFAAEGSAGLAQLQSE
jgi:Phage integrase family